MLEIGNIINHPSFYKTKLSVITEIIKVEENEFCINYHGKCRHIANKFPLVKVNKLGKEYYFNIREFKNNNPKPYMSIEDLSRSIFEIAQEVHKLKNV